MTERQDGAFWLSAPLCRLEHDAEEEGITWHTTAGDHEHFYDLRRHDPLVDKTCPACGKPVGEWPIAHRGDPACSQVCAAVVVEAPEPTDPTHGRIDKDIQDQVDEMEPRSLGARVAMENTLQERRDAAARWSQSADAGEDEDYVRRTTCPGCGHRVTGASRKVLAERTYWHQACYDREEEREKGRSGS